MNDHNLKEIPCVYSIISIHLDDKSLDVEYVGSSTKLASRYRCHRIPTLVERENPDKITLLFYKPMNSGFYDYEIKLIKKLKPKYNKQHKNG